MPQVARIVSLLIIGAVIAALGMTFYRVVAPYLLPLFLAAVLAMLSQPIYRRCMGWTRNRAHLSALLTTGIVLTSLMGPIVLGTVAASKQLYAVAQATLEKSEWAEIVSFCNEKLGLKKLLQRYHEVTGDPVDAAELEQEVQTRLHEAATTLVQKTLGSAGKTLGMLGGAVSALVGMLLFVVAYYYFLADGPALLLAAERLIPVHTEYKRQLLLQFDQVVRAVVVATFAAAAGQGVAAAAGMYVAGFRHFFIALLLATMTSLVPLLGAWLVWGPYAVWLALHDGAWGRAMGLALYGGVVVGLLDNVIRSYVLHSNARLHPLLAFVSVVGGLEVMGLWGLFVGPIVASCLHALVKIFNTELVAFAQERHDAKALDPNLATMATDGASPASLAAIPAAHRAPPTSAGPAPPEAPSNAPAAPPAQPRRAPPEEQLSTSSSATTSPPQQRGTTS